MKVPTFAGRTILLIGVAAIASACSGPSSQYCQAAAECDEEFMLIPIIGDDVPVDGVGNSDDSVGVCAAEIDGYIGALRANSEDVCQELADAYDAFMACAVMEGSCDAWTDNDCEDERDDINDLWDDAGGRCEE